MKLWMRLKFKSKPNTCIYLLEKITNYVLTFKGKPGQFAIHIVHT